MYTPYTPTRALLDFVKAVTLVLLALAAVLLVSAVAQYFSDEPAAIDDPHVTGVSIKGRDLTVTFVAALDQTQQPAPELFTVDVDGEPVPVKSVDVARQAVVLSLYGPADHDDQVLVSFTNTANPQLRTIDRTPISDFSELVAHNKDTPSDDQPMTAAHWVILTGFLLVMCAMLFGTRIWEDRQRLAAANAHSSATTAPTTG